MRFLPVVAISLLIAGLAGAQVGAPFSSQQNALGGQFGAAAMARPLGGIATGQSGHRGGGTGQGTRRATTGYVAPYGYSLYTPGLYDYGTPSSVSTYTADTPPYMMLPPPVAPPPLAPPPVIINQYFSGPPPANGAYAPPPDDTPHTAGEPLAPVDNYYLIAYKDHSVYPAI